MKLIPKITVLKIDDKSIIQDYMPLHNCRKREREREQKKLYNRYNVQQFSFPASSARVDKKTKKKIKRERCDDDGEGVEEGGEIRKKSFPCALDQKKR